VASAPVCCPQRSDWCLVAAAAAAPPRSPHPGDLDPRGPPPGATANAKSSGLDVFLAAGRLIIHALPLPLFITTTFIRTIVMAMHLLRFCQIAYLYRGQFIFQDKKFSPSLSLSLSLSLCIYIYIYIYIYTHTHTHTHTYLFNSYRSLITTFFYSLSFYLSFHNLTIKEQPPFAYLAAFVKSKSLKSEILMSNGYSTIIFETC
jgi:hypothetical protein